MYWIQTTQSRMAAWKVYVALVIFRITNVFLIQSQFDPDEYWQNLEPSYCHIFGGGDYYDTNPASCPGLTWEWKRRRQQNQQEQQQQQNDTDRNQNSWSTLLMDFFIIGLEGPVRSFASIVPTLLYYAIIKKYKWDTSWMVSRGPVFINAIFVTAVTDWTVWYMSRWMKPTTTTVTTTVTTTTTTKQQQDDANTTTTTTNDNNNRHQYANENENEQKQNDLTFWCVYCSITSWFNAYTLIRTYSNSLETVLLAVSLALVSPVFLSTNQSTTTTIRAWIAFFLGGICVSIRFTCLTAYIPMGIILALDNNNNNNNNNNTIAYLFGICALPGFLGFVSTLLLDKVMYGFWAIPVLGNFHFNVIQGNGSLYGTHPFHWYLTAGIPALTGILLPVLIYDGISKWDRARRNLWTIILCYVVTHSWSEHKEFRFLLPVLPIFCLLCGGRIQNIVIGIRPLRIKQIMITFAGINLIAILYLGLFHQRAPIDVNRAILKAVAATHRNNNNSNNKPAADIRVHYLMGCHSTPLLSHLHNPPTKFVPWFLDCSPSCRANPDKDCESVAFSKDPGGFMKQTYNFECTTTEEGEEDDETSCAASSTISNDINMGSRTFPDYVVCYSNDILKMRDQLDLMGMKEIGRFVHGINGIRIGNQLTLGDDAFSNSDFTKIGIFHDSLVVSVEEMILFQKYI